MNETPESVSVLSGGLATASVRRERPPRNGILEGTNAFEISGGRTAETVVATRATSFASPGVGSTAEVVARARQVRTVEGATVERVTYVSGDTWNVNPIALKRVERLFCKNERAVIRTRLAVGDHLVTLVPVAAILVASIRLHCLDVTMNMNYRGATEIDCDARFAKGDELGWFEHGSTIIVFAPRGFRLCDGIRDGAVIRMGRALMHLP